MNNIKNMIKIKFKDNIHISGVGSGQSAVDGWIPAGTVAEMIESGEIIKLEGLQHNMEHTFRKGDVIQLDTVGELLFGKHPEVFTNFGIPIKTKGLKARSFTIMHDAATNNDGECWIKVYPAFLSSGDYKNIHKPIPKGEKVFLAETHKVWLDFSKLDS